MPYAYEWAVLRVVPRVERCEFVNVGVLVYSRPLGYLAAQITDDLSRAATLDTGLDVAAVRQHLLGIADLVTGGVESGDNGARSAGERFRWLVAPRSTVVQTSAVHTGLTDDPAAELAALFVQMVAPPPAAQEVGGHP